MAVVSLCAWVIVDSNFVFVVVDGDSFIFFCCGRLGVTYSEFERRPYFLGRSKLENRIL